MVTSASSKRRSSAPALEDNNEEQAASAKRRSIVEDKENGAENEEQEEEVGEAVAGIRRINVEGRPAEAGIIKTIYVENFMCHRKLRVDLCRNVNFVSGQNGSGKSAILAAIQICLGAGARRTNRARNLKELVRKEASSGNSPAQAKIRVTLLNQGEDGYKHEIYGDSITVERTISLNGGYNGYRLLDHDGKEKSKSKKDLDDMLDLLNIQVENPVAVLDQEEAKKFLTGKAEDKYNFFMKATELERVDRTYANTMDDVQELQESKEKIKDSLQQGLERVEGLKKKWQEHQALEKLEEKLAEAKVKYAWAYYNAADNEFDEAAQSMQNFQEKANRKKNELSQAEESAKSPNDDEQTKRSKMDQLVQEAQEQAERKRTLEADLKKATLPFKELERQHKTLKRQQASSNGELVLAKKRLQDLRDQILAQSGSAESEEALRTALLSKTEQELGQARGIANQLRQDTSNALRGHDEAEPHVQDAKGKVKHVEMKLHAVNNTIRDLASSSTNALAILGPRVSKVHQMVQREAKNGRFKGTVVGPIGSFIKIAPGKEEFAGIAEFAIGNGTLDRFIVTNDQDRKMMQDIRKSVGCRQDCGIFQVHASARFNVPGPPADGIETVASVLSIPNDLVFNCLVDNARIDTRALAKDMKSSQDKLLSRDGQGRQCIRGNIKEVYFLPNADKWMVKGGSMAAISNERKLRNTIGADATEALAQSKREAAQIQQELKELRSVEARREQEHTNLSRAWNKAKKAMSQNDTLISQLQSKVDEIKEVETTANDTIDTSECEEDVSQAENAIDQLQTSGQKLEDQLSSHKPEIDAIKSSLDETVIRNTKIMEDMQKAEAEITTFLETQTQQQDQINKKRRKLEQYEQAIKKHQEKLDAVAADKEKSLMTARILHHRLTLRKQLAQEEEEGAEDGPKIDLDVEPTKEVLEAIEPLTMKREPEHFQVRIDRANAKIKEERKKRKVTQEDPAEAYEKYMRAKTEVDGKTKQIHKIERKCDELRHDMKERKKRWKQLRGHLDRTTTIKFDEMLRLNKYSGSLDFSHKTNTLDLIVQKDNATAASQTKDVKALSGGERSFTTMCLLLALGESLQTPFRILDEFDVFLDAQVRKLTIQALIHVAKKMKHRQFIFITPQDLTSIKPDSELKILKLLPPERHANVGGPTQQTLPFTSQNSD